MPGDTSAHIVPFASLPAFRAKREYRCNRQAAVLRRNSGKNQEPANVKQTVGENEPPCQSTS